jgi:hypothetical protein
MKFRQKRMLAGHNSFTYRQERLETVTWFKHVLKIRALHKNTTPEFTKNVLYWNGTMH